MMIQDANEAWKSKILKLFGNWFRDCLHPLGKTFASVPNIGLVCSEVLYNIFDGDLCLFGLTFNEEMLMKVIFKKSK